MVLFPPIDMTQDATGPTKKAADQSSSDAAGALGAYNGDIGDYMSNVNSAIAAGNPYESKDYLTKQNLETSGAMNSEKDAADQALQTTAARTGTNTAALAGTEANIARTGARDLTQYNAGRDTANAHDWEAEKGQLMGDQLAGANSEAGVYGTATGGRDSALSSYTQAADAENQMWGNLAGSAIGAGGTAYGGFLAGRK